jgi:G3E family GTPase
MQTHRARYLMIGGFLGAGKTTSVLQLAKHLHQQGLRVGVIMNDQASGLVDTALTHSQQLDVEEIAGGCFCCRFNSLLEAASQLTEKNRPDVLIAEPVGSCTDLIATVNLPLQKIYGDQFEIGPLSVVVDPIRARRALGLEAGRSFSANVTYIYRKQLEEAQMIVINKTDLVSAEEQEELTQALYREFPQAKIYRISARHSSGLEPWFHELMNAESAIHQSMEVDYQRYGEGEAMLGWLNATLEIQAEEVDGNQLLMQLAKDIRRQMQLHHAEIAHMKMILSADPDGLEIAALNCTSTEREPELSHRLSEEIDHAEILINLRAEAAPETLENALQEALREIQRKKINAEITLCEHFRPGQPVPTHRFSAD